MSAVREYRAIMSSMSLKHTKSPSGKTHVLTHVSKHPVPTVTEVAIRYRETPQYDDQVQGDLFRKMQAEHGLAYGVGILPVTIDPDLLDRGQQAPNLDYLRGYLAGLTEDPSMRHLSVLIRRTKEQIAKLEAAQARGES